MKKKQTSSICKDVGDNYTIKLGLGWSLQDLGTKRILNSTERSSLKRSTMNDENIIHWSLYKNWWKLWLNCTFIAQNAILAENTFFIYFKIFFLKAIILLSYFQQRSSSLPYFVEIVPGWTSLAKSISSPKQYLIIY